jgi:hypothetical protein
MLSMGQETSARSRAAKRFERLLARSSAPRFQMFVMVSATGVAAFLASVLLLHLGLHAMWLRYGFSVGVAYGMFLALVWMWMLWYRKRWTPRVDVTDIADAATDFDLGGPGGSLFDFSFDLDLEEGALALVVLAAVACAVAAAAYVILDAPSLLAEVLLDSVLSAGLYRRLRKIEQRHWLESAVRKTGLPFLLVAVFFMAAGALGHWYAPDAVSIGGVLRHILRTS